MNAPAMLVTGFGPFMDIAENPSGMIATALECEHVVLPVSYQAVDDWLATDPARHHQAILRLDVAGGAETFRLELFAHNELRGENQT